MKHDTEEATSVDWSTLNWDKIDDCALALLFFGRHEGVRTWKGFDWEILNRLHEKGYISDPVGKAKSVVFTEDGLARSANLVRDMFGRR